MPSTGTKRPHDSLHSSYLPPLPAITSDEISNQVFAHKSLGEKSKDEDDSALPCFEEHERLVEIGRSVLDLAVTRHVFLQKPMLTKEEMKSMKQDILNQSNLAIWTKEYAFTEKIRAREGVDLTGEQEQAAIFYAYFGGVYVDSEYTVEATQRWLDGLMGESIPDEDTPKTPPAKKRKLSVEGGTLLQDSFLEGYETESPRIGMPPLPTPNGTPQHLPFAAQPPAAHYFQPFQPSAPTVASTYPGPMYVWPGLQSPGPGMGYAPQPPPPPHPLAHPPQPQAVQTAPKGGPTKTFIQKFNEVVSKKKVVVEWKCVQSGRSHDGEWSAQCAVNGILKGHGKGSKMKVAKESAARAAAETMGWLV